MAFWQAQQFLTVLLIPQGWEHDAINWQRAQTGFTLWSVFLASCLIGPFFEELLFRGLIYTQIRHKAGTLLAISVSSGMFTLLHWNSSEAVWLFSAAVIYAILREKSGSIWPSVIAHVIQNVLTFWLYVSI
nr:CPBP family intramembrane glutamic endopeptidase [Marinicella rhabdoformis]